jgi:hypothetical protein
MTGATLMINTLRSRRSRTEARVSLPRAGLVLV